MGTRSLVASIVTILTCALAAIALDGYNGSTVTELVTAGDVHDAYGTYDALGNQEATNYGQNDDVATDSAGNVWFLASGYDSDGDFTTSTALAVLDTDGATSILTEAVLGQPSSGGPPARTGEVIRSVTVSPVTAGLLTEDHPVIGRTCRVDTDSDTYFEIVSVDPSDSTETVVYAWDTTPYDGPYVFTDAHGIVRVDADGTIYVLADHSVDGSAYPNAFPLGTLFRLVWNEATGEYEETDLTEAWDLPALGTGLLLDSEGDLYTFEDGVLWGSFGSTVEILRIDASTGSVSTWAELEGGKNDFWWFQSWTFDTGGRLWLGLREAIWGKTGLRYVTEIRADETLTRKTAAARRIAEADLAVRALCAGPEGVLHAVDVGLLDSSNDAIFAITPSEGDVDGGGKPPKKDK